jgi:hypothetical protein
MSNSSKSVDRGPGFESHKAERILENAEVLSVTCFALFVHSFESKKRTKGNLKQEAL